MRAGQPKVSALGLNARVHVLRLRASTAPHACHVARNCGARRCFRRVAL